MLKRWQQRSTIRIHKLYTVKSSLLPRCLEIFKTVKHVSTAVKQQSLHCAGVCSLTYNLFTNIICCTYLTLTDNRKWTTNCWHTFSVLTERADRKFTGSECQRLHLRLTATSWARRKTCTLVWGHTLDRAYRIRQNLSWVTGGTDGSSFGEFSTTYSCKYLTINACYNWAFNMKHKQEVLTAFCSNINRANKADQSTGAWN